MSKKKANIVLLLRKKDPFSIKLGNFIKNRFVNTRIIWSSKTGEKNKMPNNLKSNFIFCYRSYYILKKINIKNSKFPPINFHPGPPNFRGFGCANFALYNKSKFYGITTHLINEKIDSGRIIDVKYFKIKKNDNLEKILKKTHKYLYLNAKRFIPKIIKNPLLINNLKNKNKKIKWSGKVYKKSDLEKLYLIKKKFSQKKINNILRATYLKNSKFKPRLIN